jgi:hypothetical protein
MRTPIERIVMDKFMRNLKRQAEENPIMAIAVGVAVLTALGKFVDAAGHAAGSRAYAKQVNYRVKTPR